MKYHFEKTSCTICGSNTFYKVCNRGQFNLKTYVVICKNCGLTFLNPRWTKNTYSEFYKFEYDRFYGRDIFTGFNFKNIKVIYERYSKLNINHEFHKILDIGSGRGDALMWLKERFNEIEPFAIESSRECYKTLIENNIKYITHDVDLNWVKKFNNYFSFIIMRHVLEHFINPSDILNKISNILTDDGLVYIAVPNSKKPRPPLLTNYFRVVHTYYFNKYTLTKIIEKANLDIIDLHEGDKNNNYELFLFAKKSNTKKNQSSYKNIENYNIQKSIFKEILKDEKRNFTTVLKYIMVIFIFPKNLIIKGLGIKRSIKKLIKNSFH